MMDEAKPEQWFHFCEDSKKREARNKPWSCAQCGATDPNGQVSIVAVLRDEDDKLYPVVELTGLKQ